MLRHEVRDWIDVFQVQQSTKQFAAMLGFAKRECTELAIVASELTSNILKYGIQGAIEIEMVTDERGIGIAIIASDCGPPFRNLDAAVQDGYDDQGPIDPILIFKRKGMGGGLGAVLRLSHSFVVEPQAVGKKIHVVRYLTVKPGSPRG